MRTLLTIPGLTKKSKQELFDMSARHILSTGKPSVAGDANAGACIYSGSGCAAAPFINPENRVEADVEGGSWATMVDLGYAPKGNSGFIRELQECHDDNAWGWAEDGSRPVNPDFIRDWRASMVSLAEKYSLSTAALDA